MPAYCTPLAPTPGACDRISVVIPALDESGNIGRLIEETFAAVPASLLEEVVVVDDASGDATGDEVSRLMPHYPRLRLIRHLVRAGQSSATRTGIRFAAGDLIATMDGDGQNDPGDILRLYNVLMAEGTGTTLAGGVRATRKAEGSKRIASRLANWLRDRVLDDGCPDTGCGIKVFSRRAYLDLPFFCGMHRYLPALFQTYGYRTVFLPVNDRARRNGRSKYTNLGRALLGIRDLAGVSWIRTRTRLSPVAEVRRLETSATGDLHRIDAATTESPVRTVPLLAQRSPAYAGVRA